MCQRDVKWLILSLPD
ncbi:hypothetical protein MTR67_052506 [Solanum verrucosum]|uniref:Uncharacterized protein n=1 Tax=Solanum verrucosum TaxID=315347 RepID=A0AAF0V980_SOLVR|nr:hypothetical protein MTR67_052506 [Solanum verrucosum]